MRRITRTAWLIMAGALLASALSVVALMRVSTQPWLATPLPPGQPLLTVAVDDTVIVVTATGAYRVRPYLHVDRIVWNDMGRIVAVRSAAWNGGQLAMVASVARDGQPATPTELLIVDGDRMMAAPVANPISVLKSENGFLAFTLEDQLVGTMVELTEGDWSISRVGTHSVHPDAVDGVVGIEGKAFVLVGERGAHWLIDGEHKLRALPEGAYSVWSASLLHPPVNDAARVPFLDEHGQAQAFAPAGAPSLRVEPAGPLPWRILPDTVVSALQITHGLDEPGVFVTHQGKRRLEVKHAHSRISVSSADQVSWHAVATSVAPHDFSAIPLGDHWLLLGGAGGEGVEIDDHFSRFDHADSSATVAALTSQPRSVWLALLALLGGLALGLPFLVKRTIARLSILDLRDGLFVGELKLPPGAVGQTGRDGRVTLAGNCQLRAGARCYDLASGPARFDEAANTPLVDGERVYVVGRSEADQSGGPWRASHRERLGPDGGHYLIGRGSGDDFARRWSGRINWQLMAFAWVHLMLAAAVLTFLGLRPFL